MKVFSWFSKFFKWVWYPFKKDVELEKWHEDRETLRKMAEDGDCVKSDACPAHKKDYKSYGLVFRDNDAVWCAEFGWDANSVYYINDAYLITDEKGIYNCLNEFQFSFVGISQYQEDVIVIEDLRQVEISNEEDPTKNVRDLIQEGALYDLSIAVFEEWYNEPPKPPSPDLIA